jgi:putative component of membrane protein insertase Oxa1/YidC/SpoIIIJ protein YidD
MVNKKYVITLFLILQHTVFSQTDWVRWEKSDPTYQSKNPFIERKYDLSVESVSDIIVKPVINAYWFFVSDVDGANCPFQPSCSSFFVESIKETNPVQGALMFFDRFTRDTNIFGRQNQYPKFDSKHYYDPISLYTLDETKIKIIPANSIINEK